MPGQDLEPVYWRRLERLHQRLHQVEAWIATCKASSQPTPTDTDILTRASKIFGLATGAWKLLAWAGPWILMGGAMLWGWLKLAWRLASGPQG